MIIRYLDPGGNRCDIRITVEFRWNYYRNLGKFYLDSLGPCSAWRISMWASTIRTGPALSSMLGGSFKMLLIKRSG